MTLSLPFDNFLIPPRARPQFEGLTETLPPKSLIFCVILDNKNCVNFNALGEDSHSALRIEDGPEEGIKKIIEGQAESHPSK